MKRLIKLMMIAATTVMALGCTEEMVETNLSVVSTELEAAAEGVVLPIKFNASAAWTAESDQAWVTLSKESGDAGEATIEATVAANDTYEDRTAVVTIKAADKEVKYTIVQKMLTSFEAEFVYEISAEAQEIKFAMESNVDYEFIIADNAKSWIEEVAAAKAAPTESEKVFKIKANSELAPREGVIVVKTGPAVYGMIVKQYAQFENLPEATATCIGRTMKIYYNYTYYNFTEYAIVLKGEETEVTLAVNAAADADVAVLPEGEFLIDADGTHAENTFSIKPIDGSESVYTTIVENGTEVAVEDGAITIAKDGDVYTITAILVDNHENEKRYSFIGEIASVEDKSVGGYISEVSYSGQYNTYYTTNANGWDFVVPISKAPDADSKNMSYASFTVYSENTVEGGELPTGTFTFAEEKENETVKYENGKYMYKAGDLDGLWLYENNGEQGWKADKTSTLTINKNEDGTYSIAFDTKLFYETNQVYDETYNIISSDTTRCEYKATIDNIRTTYDEVNIKSQPTPDGDVELVRAMGACAGMYYGDKAVFAALETPVEWSVNSSLLVLGYTMAYSATDATYTLYLAVNAPGYQWEANLRNKYCTTPPADGTYTFSRDIKADNALFPLRVLNLKADDKTYCYIQNAYTGTTMPVVGGSLKIENGNITFDLEVECIPENKTYKVTGTMPFTYQFAQDKSAHASYVEIAAE